MSKRLLSSKASKRGRLLRPRTESRSGGRPSSTSLTPEELAAANIGEAVGGDPIGGDWGPEAIVPASPSTPPEALTDEALLAQAPPASTRERITVNESGKPADDAFADAIAAHERVSQTEIEAAPVAPLKTLPAEAPKPIVEAKPVAIEVEAPKPVAETKPAEAKKNDAKVEAKPAEAKKNDAKVEAKPAEAKKNDAKVEAKPAEAKKNDAKVETKKAEAKPLDTGKVAAKTKGKSPQVVIRDEEIDNDPSSLDFFKRTQDSLTPVTESTFHDVVDAAPPPSAAAIARREKFKRFVGGVVAASSLVAIIGIGRMLFSSKAADASTQQANATRVTPTPGLQPNAEPKKEEPAKAAAPAPEPKPAPVETAAPAATDAPSADVAATAAPSADPAADAKPATAATADEIKALKKAATVAINSGNNKKAVETAEAAIAADPTDAMMYLYLGSAHLNTGKAKEAREAFNACMRNATTGPKYECAAMGGKK